MTLRHLEYGLAALAAAVILGVLAWAGLGAGTGGAVVLIQTKPDRASAWLDGRYVGTTPVTCEGIYPGTHVLRVTKFGCRPLLRELDLRKGPNELKFDLVQLVGGTLSITSNPPEAEVFVDGESRGVTPLAIKGLGPGEHSVRLLLVNYLDWTGTAEIEEGKTAELKAALKTRTEEHYLAEIALHPKDAVLPCDLAHYYILRGEWQKAEDAFTRSLVLTATEGESADYSSRLFQEIEKVFHAQFKYDNVPRGQQAVVDALVRAVKACPSYTTCYAYAIAYAAERGMSDRAQEVLETGIIAFPYDQNWAVQTVQRRFQPEGGGSLDRFIDVLSARIRQSPNDFTARFQRATLQRQKGDLDGVIEDYEQLAKLAKSTDVRARLLEETGRTWERKHDLEKAADAYSRAVKTEQTKKDKAPIYYSLVRVLASLKRNDEAHAAWKDAVDAQEDVEVACRWRLEWAQFNIGAGKLDLAKPVLADVLKLTKDDRTRARAQELLEQTKNP